MAGPLVSHFGAATSRGFNAAAATNYRSVVPTFAFAAALFALPLAGVPVLLHLLHRQKSPVVMFSTLRFVKLSVQRTAARRRLQKWLLLACRSLLVALLIGAVAQPLKRLTGGWLGGGGSSAMAAVVVDTSYSMQLQDGGATLLSKADAAVQDLLRGPLAGAKVAVFTSRPPDGKPEGLRDASAVLADWSPLRPQAASAPLVDRAAAAVALLDRQPPGSRWLVVISDFQADEFGHPVPQAKDARTVLIDLHPADAAAARSAGITKVTVTPQQLVSGLPAEAAVEVTGPPGEGRAVRFRTATVDGKPLADVAPAMATLDATGRGTARFPVAVPAERFVALTAELTADDAMAWDNARTQVVEVPPRQRVAFLQQVGGSPGERFARLALDPSEGTLAEWPLGVHPAVVPAADDDVAVAVLARWPGPHTADVLRDFARAGHTVVLFLTPGLETSWAALPAGERDALAAVLPSTPAVRPGGDVPSRAVVAAASDPLLAGLTDEKFELNKVIVRRLVPLAADGDATAVLNAAPVDPTPGSRTQGLLFRRPVGRGVCYTFATTPDPATTNLGTHPTFLPLLVRTALRPPDRSAAQNVELGRPLTIDPLLVPPSATALQVTGPQGEQYQVARTAGRFTFAGAAEPGIYAWHRLADAATVAPLAVSNVQLPAAESDLTYRPAATVAPPDPATVVASSVADLRAKVDQLTAPDPQWQWPLAVVMCLLCLEGLMGSLPKAWQTPAALRAFLPGRPAAADGPAVTA